MGFRFWEMGKLVTALLGVKLQLAATLQLVCSSCKLKNVLHPSLGSPVVPFCPFWFGASLLESNSRKKGTLTIKGLLENLAQD